MSEPTLHSGSHLSADRSADSRHDHASFCHPPTSHHSASSRLDDTDDPPTDSDDSSADYHSQQTHDDDFSDSSNDSPQPSTASRGRSSQSSALPDLSTLALSWTKDSSPSDPNKTYAFVSLPGNAVRKRPRRRYDEIERIYQCSWPECAKSYGTLNHLNAHVVMQKHGSKRQPSEFKELRKQRRKAKKEESHSAAPGQSPPNANSHQPHAVNPHSLTSVDMQDPMSDRRRRMTDSSLPGIASYRASNPHLQPRDSPQGSMDPYEESVHANSHGPQNSEYSLGPSRLLRDPTLSTPVNLDGARDGKDI